IAERLRIATAPDGRQVARGRRLGSLTGRESGCLWPLHIRLRLAFRCPPGSIGDARLRPPEAVRLAVSRWGRGRNRNSDCRPDRGDQWHTRELGLLPRGAPDLCPSGIWPTLLFCPSPWLRAGHPG